MKIEIRNRFNGKVIFTHEEENNTIKKTVVKAVTECADLEGANLVCVDLRGANLEGANLEGVDLGGADLRGVDLRGAKNCYIFQAYDTSKRIVYCVKHKKTWMVKAGCFWGTIDELEKKVKSTHNSPVYLANIEILKKL